MLTLLLAGVAVRPTPPPIVSSPHSPPMISLQSTAACFRPYTGRVLDLSYMAYAAPCLRSEDYGSGSAGAVIVISI